MSSVNTPKQMTPEEHKKRHEELFGALDELVADFLLHNFRKHQRCAEDAKGLSNTTVMELLEWSRQQTLNPEELP